MPRVRVVCGCRPEVLPSPRGMHSVAGPGDPVGEDAAMSGRRMAQELTHPPSPLTLPPPLHKRPVFHDCPRPVGGGFCFRDISGKAIGPRALAPRSGAHKTPRRGRIPRCFRRWISRIDSSPCRNSRQKTSRCKPLSAWSLHVAPRCLLPIFLCLGFCLGYLFSRHECTQHHHPQHQHPYPLFAERSARRKPRDGVLRAGNHCQGGEGTWTSGVQRGRRKMADWRILRNG